MQKKQVWNMEDTNIALIGSDIDKKCKQASAQTEKAWVGAGKAPGIQIWRIEKFQVVPSKTAVGEFYSDDSYIVLNTYKVPDSDKLHWDIHFWLGKTTSQDEMGTAAYKTVELDNLLGGEPVQHREVQDGESSLFLGYFAKTGGIRILEGGIESGFKHVKPEEFKPRLLWVKGRKNVRIKEVEMSYKSLNSGDVFILDAGLKLLQFNGSKSGAKEKGRAAQLTRALKDERKGFPKITVFEENDREMDDFWSLLGGQGEIQSGDGVAGDEKWEEGGAKKLFRFSDASGREEFTKIAEGRVLKSMLDTNDAFILDVGAEVFVWIGLKASAAERAKAMQTAINYLRAENRPMWLPVTRILEGGENETFGTYFDHAGSSSSPKPKPSANQKSCPKCHEKALGLFCQKCGTKLPVDAAPDVGSTADAHCKHPGCKKPGVSGSGHYLDYCADHFPTEKKETVKTQGGTKCIVCGKTVYPNEAIQTTAPVHPACFKCSHCHATLSLRDYAQDQGKLFCKYHFQKITYGGHFDK